MFIDPRESMAPPPLTHDPFKALVIPRPIGWISTMSRKGDLNLAPFSYYNAVCSDPPRVMFCPNDRVNGRPKDTRVYAEETGEFVCNLATFELRQQMSDSSEGVPVGVDEMAMTHLTPAPCRKVKTPRVRESPVAFECIYEQTVDLPGRDEIVRDYIVIGEVVGIHIDDDVIVDGIVDPFRLKAIARLGYIDYVVAVPSFTMGMPKF